ncbi:MAG: CHAP domain-containing protein [Blautia sp.]|nr:CHAP domain-containing protein [Blautia sp.]
MKCKELTIKKGIWLSLMLSLLCAAKVWANPYSSGQCTWWAYERASQLHGSCPVISGNAGGWYDNCLSVGLNRGSTPTVGSIACWNNGFGNDSGHVAIVEAVYSDHIHISEYNWAVSEGYSEADVYFSN